MPLTLHKKRTRGGVEKGVPNAVQIFQDWYWKGTEQAILTHPAGQATNQYAGGACERIMRLRRACPRHQ